MAVEIDELIGNDRSGMRRAAGEREGEQQK
jgi:hypothetical protein